MPSLIPNLLGRPIYLVFDHDLAGLVGNILKNDFELRNDILAIDGVTVHDFDPSTRSPAIAGDRSLGVPPENRGVVLSEHGSIGSPPRGRSRGSESKDNARGAPGVLGGLHFIDLGKVLEPSSTVPATVKSLVYRFLWRPDGIEGPNLGGA